MTAAKMRIVDAAAELTVSQRALELLKDEVRPKGGIAT